MKSDGIIQELNHLVQICQAGSEGFRKAASEVDNEQFQELFLSTARLRSGFVLQLQNEIRKRRARAMSNPNMGARLHRTWMKFRHQINPHNDEVVLRECWRGEQHALKAYENVFDRAVFPELQPMLDEQFVNMVEMRNLLQEKAHRSEEPGSLLHL